MMRVNSRHLGRVLLVSGVCFSFSYGQSPFEEISGPIEPIPFHYKFSQGFLNSFSAWDLSLVGLFALNNIKPDEEDDQIRLVPLSLDRQVARDLSRSPYPSSYGSRLSPTKMQSVIFFGQLGVTALLDLVTDAEITPEDYSRAFVFAKTMVYTFTLTEITKNWVARTRPDGSDTRSFFSGHTSNSFAASAFMYRELKDWVDGPTFAHRSDFTRAVIKATAFTITYGWATYVGYSRMRDGKHFLSDVLVGAAFGMLMGNLFYDNHFGTPGELSALQLTLIPSSRPAVGFTYTF